ncbi:glycerophosphodiester phosphodiesterase family protein [Erythrobacter sp. HA6-11]
MKAIRLKLAASIGFALVASASLAQSEPSGQWQIVPETTLSASLDCFEATEQTLISAHRGGPSPGLPENAIETMDAVLTAIPAVMEVDVARSTDGVHYLMHDRTLDRTTTGAGSVRDASWEDVSQLYLVDEAGWVTPYRVPTLSAALAWAKGKTVLQIDFKRTANFEEVIAEIRAAKMAQSVILIAYTAEAATKLHALAPEMLISFSISSPDDLATIEEAGVPDESIVAFTGTRVVRPDLYAQLDDRDVEVIFGTLGRSRNSLDNIFERFGTDERYAELAEGGVDIIATDRPRAAAQALQEAERLPQAGQCGVSRAD